MAAEGFADELLAVARQQGNSDFLLQAHHAGWTTRFHLADQVACREHTAQGRALYDIEAHASHRFVYGGHDPGVCACNHGALATWLLGYPDQALSLSREGHRAGRVPAPSHEPDHGARLRLVPASVPPGA